MKKQRGITLIALVITIIVLLILAGVSISLVMGNNGVLNQAKNGVTQTKKSTAQEEVTLAWAACESDYWTAWAKDSSVAKAQFFNNNLSDYLSSTGTLSSFSYADGNNTFEYQQKDSTEKYEITVDYKGEVISVGKASEPQALSTLTSSNYGDYIDLGQSIIGTTATTDDWKILYNDTTNNTVYVILADYLPNDNSAVVASGVSTSDTYNVYSSSRNDFLNKLTNVTTWQSLILENLRDVCQVKGAVAPQILISSYNEKYGTNYRYQSGPYLCEDESKNGGCELYMSHPGGYYQGCNGYWLASAFEYNSAALRMIENTSVGPSIGAMEVKDKVLGLRPIVSIPSNMEVKRSTLNGATGWRLVQ